MTNSTELWVIGAHVTYDAALRWDDAMTSQMHPVIRLFSYIAYHQCLFVCNSTHASTAKTLGKTGRAKCRMGLNFFHGFAIVLWNTYIRMDSVRCKKTLLNWHLFFTFVKHPTLNRRLSSKSKTARNSTRRWCLKRWQQMTKTVEYFWIIDKRAPNYSVLCDEIGLSTYHRVQILFQYLDQSRMQRVCGN